MNEPIFHWLAGLLKNFCLWTTERASVHKTFRPYNIKCSWAEGKCYREETTNARIIKTEPQRYKKLPQIIAGKKHKQTKESSSSSSFGKRHEHVKSFDKTFNHFSSVWKFLRNFQENVEMRNAFFHSPKRHTTIGISKLQCRSLPIGLKQSAMIKVWSSTWTMFIIILTSLRIENILYVISKYNGFSPSHR